MTVQVTFADLEDELKSHDFKLITFNENEIKIKGISGMTVFMIIMMSFIGCCLMAFGFISVFAIAKPEYVAGVLLTVAGLVLIFLPFYNYYSKSYFEIDFNKPDQSVVIKSLDPVPSKQVIRFNEIESLHLKKNTLNSYVDNTTKGSYIYSYSLSLKLKNNMHKPVIHFSKRDERIEKFSINFTDLLVNLTGIQKEFEVAQ